MERPPTRPTLAPTRVPRVFHVVVSGLCLALLVSARWAGAQPDPRQMSGIPLPSGDLPVGTVLVRVIRSQLSNNVPDHLVELRVDGRSLTATTDDEGRAQFPGLTAGARARASTEVDGERIESEEFTVPDRGGVRLMLVATTTPAGTTAVSPQPGAVTLGGQSRFVVELDDEALRVYYLLDIVNPTGAPVSTSSPLAFELPSGAQGATLLQGSTPQAMIDEQRVIVRDPFPSGTTSLQVAYVLPYSGSRVVIAQSLPATLETVNVIIETAGAMRASSPQFARQRDMSAEGHTYVLGNGPGIAANSVLTLEFEGLPHRQTWSNRVAFSLAMLIVGLGAWAAAAGPEQAPGRVQERQRLQQRRERLFDDLVRLEEQVQSGRGSAEALTGKRQALVAQLERVCAHLDEAVAPTVVSASTAARDAAVQQSGAR